MPIKINLLAEVQATEEARRRDPVKRVIWMSGVLILIMLVWGGIEFSKTMVAQSALQKQERIWKTSEPVYTDLFGKEKASKELEKKLNALTALSTNRFLWGSALNAFQQSISDRLADQVQFISLRGTYTFGTFEITPPKPKNATKAPPKIIQATEKLSIMLDVRDFGTQADQNWRKLEAAIFSVPFFRSNLVREDAINLKSKSPQSSMTEDGRPYTTFTLECAFPEKRREELK